MKRLIISMAVISVLANFPIIKINNCYSINMINSITYTINKTFGKYSITLNDGKKATFTLNSSGTVTLGTGRIINDYSVSTYLTNVNVNYGTVSITNEYYSLSSGLTHLYAYITVRYSYGVQSASSTYVLTIY